MDCDMAQTEKSMKKAGNKFLLKKKETENLMFSYVL
jgi:hypothetical protein